MILIGLHGKAGAGKDTFADRLVTNSAFVKRGFADPLYEEVSDAFRVPVAWMKDRANKERPQASMALMWCADHDFVTLMHKHHGWSQREARSPREILQHWGTEYRRGQDDDYWLKRMDEFRDRLNKPLGRRALGLVIPDVRFDNEATWVRKNGGHIVVIVRPDIPSVAAHASERGITLTKRDMHIFNNGKISDLYAVADTTSRCCAPIGAMKAAHG